MTIKLFPALLVGMLLSACATPMKLVSLRDSVSAPLQVTIYKAPL